MKRVSFETHLNILETLNEGIRILDDQGVIVYANQTLCTLLGYDKDELIGKSVFDLYPENEWHQIHELLAQHKAGQSSQYETRFVLKTGHELIAEVSAAPVLDEKGQFKGSFTIINDITDRKQLEKQISEEKDFLNKLISLCPDGIIGVNRQGKIIIFNRAAEELTLHKAENVIGQMNVADIYESLEQARSIKKNMYAPEDGGPGRLQDFETEIVTHAGGKVPIRLSATLIHRDGQEIGNVGFFHDISDRIQLEAKLRDLSVRDSLTGLFNQRHFHSVLAEEFARAHRYERPLSLICFDLDNFKQYNDTLGHLEGDNILRLVGEYLREIIRKTDRAFRYGGDEFMILLPETAIADAYVAAEKVRKHFNSSWPYEAACKKYGLAPVTLSIGVAEVNPKDEPETLVKRTDLAMYEAKRSGGDCTVEAL